MVDRSISGHAQRSPESFLVKNKPNDNSQTRQAGHSEVALNGCVGPEEASNGTLECE